MINISEDAAKNILEYFADKEIQPVRIFLNSGG